MTGQYKTLAEHRDKQISALHLLIADHNKRVEEDEARLQNFHQQQEELDNYTKTDMAAPDGVCLDVADIERLRGAWSLATNAHSR